MNKSEKNTHQIFGADFSSFVWFHFVANRCEPHNKGAFLFIIDRMTFTFSALFKSKLTTEIEDERKRARVEKKAGIKRPQVWSSKSVYCCCYQQRDNNYCLLSKAVERHIEIRCDEIWYFFLFRWCAVFMCTGSIFCCCCHSRMLAYSKWIVCHLAKMSCVDMKFGSNLPSYNGTIYQNCRHCT